jgi:chorismate dehydratase
MRWKLTAVSYLNTKPFLYGLAHSDLVNEMDLSLEVPAASAAKLLAGEADIGLIPVAVLPEIPQARVITDYCIGAVGPVKSVCIFSHVPLREVRRVLLDYQSRTSVALAQVLFRHHFKMSPQLVPAKPGFELEVQRDEGALIIGDRAIELQNRFCHQCDLAEAWRAFTGLPFVFAAWVAGKPVPDSLIERLNNAFSFGIKNVDAVAAEYAGRFPDFDVRHYLTNSISYTLDAEKQKGLNRFLELMGG